MKPYNTFTLPNGLRIIHTPSPTAVAYCGYAINAGTRDEQPHEAGLAHFVEHMLFKGTTKRRAWLRLVNPLLLRICTPSLLVSCRIRS